MVWLHGGPQEHIGHTYSAYFQVLVAAGFAVFAPNYRGSSGRGAAFAEQAVNHLGERDVQDVTSGIARMIDAGLMHEHKVGFWGWHYGATLALILCSREEYEAKAIVAGAPFVDWIGAFGAVADPSPMEGYFGSDWWSDRAPFDALSPITHVAKLAVPVLLIQGQQDRLLPLSQSMLLYRSLMAQSVAVDLIYYVNEGHVLRGSSAIRDMLSRSLVWFEEHLVDFKPSEFRPKS